MRGIGVWALGGGFGVDGGWYLGVLAVGIGELVEEGEDLLGGLALEVGEMVDGLVDQGVVIGWIGEVGGFRGDFFFLGLIGDDLLLWTGDRGIGGGRSGQFRAGFCRFLRFFVIETGLVGALLGAAVDVLRGAADFAGKGVELGLSTLAGSEIVDGRESVGVGGDVVVLDGKGEAKVEEVERFEQDVVGGRRGDAGPVGLDQLEVGSDGGPGDFELFGDLSLGASTLGEVMGVEAASSSVGRDVHGCGLP